MSASDVDVRDTVLGIFERVRQRPSTPYDAERFLAYLTHPPSNNRRVADTFRGRHRLVRFIHAVQLHFGICFTLDEWERGFGVDAFVELVTAKMARPGQGLRLARQRLQEAQRRRVEDPIKFGLFISPLLIPAAASIPWPLRILAPLLWATIVGLVIAAVIGDLRHYRKLVARIEQAAGSERP